MLKIISLLVLSIASISEARTKVKIAILDNLQSEKISTERYVTDYLQGIDLGVHLASKQGIDFETKEFLFEKNNVEILPKIEQIKIWKPDVIIGPRSSDLFILLQKHFNDILTISPFATAEEVSRLPSNFYSVMPDNAETTELLVKFVKKAFPGKSVFQIIQLDCKNCVDAGEQFAKFAVGDGIKLRLLKPATVVSSVVETTPMDKLLDGYQNGDLIQIPNNSFVSGTLAGRISNHLKQKQLIFLGSSGWGDWKVGYFGKFPSPYEYLGYRMVIGSTEFKDPQTLNFQKLYKNFYNRDANVNITRINFVLMDGLTDLISRLKKTRVQINRVTILDEFKKMKVKDQNLWRSKTVGVFKTDQKGEVLQELSDTIL